MIYKYVNIHFHSAEDIAHLRKPIEIFKHLVEELRPLVKASNFNKYFASRSTGKPYLTPNGQLIINPDGRIVMQIESAEARMVARFGFDGQNEDQIIKTLTRVAEEEKTAKQIQDYDKTFAGIWQEPDFVMQAHELGTAWALELSNWLDQNQDICQALESGGQSKKAGFMAQLVHLILLNSKLNSYLDWAALRESPTYEKDKLKHHESIVNLAQKCSFGLTEKCNTIGISLVPSFLERVFHAFFNCTYPGLEETALSWQITGMFWQSIISRSLVL